jgi:formylmethanofuran dehydrogenase subunit B
MRGHFNVTGADEVSLWQTGYPFAVNFSRGYPVYNPGEFSAVDILARGECDAALIIASDPVANFPIEASKHLAKIPTIVMDPKFSMTSMVAEVVIPTAMAGIECEGTAYRMDGVPIRLRKVIEPKYPPDKEILKRMIEGLKT